jgi:hypothetical protein
VQDDELATASRPQAKGRRGPADERRENVGGTDR